MTCDQGRRAPAARRTAGRQGRRRLRAPLRPPSSRAPRTAAGSVARRRPRRCPGRARPVRTARPDRPMSGRTPRVARRVHRDALRVPAVERERVEHRAGCRPAGAARAPWCRGPARAGPVRAAARSMVITRTPASSRYVTPRRPHPPGRRRSRRAAPTPTGSPAHGRGTGVGAAEAGYADTYGLGIAECRVAGGVGVAVAVGEASAGAACGADRCRITAHPPRSSNTATASTGSRREGGRSSPSRSATTPPLRCSRASVPRVKSCRFRPDR